MSATQTLATLSAAATGAFEKIRLTRAEKALVVLSINRETNVVEVAHESVEEDIEDALCDVILNAPRYIIYHFIQDGDHGRKVHRLVFVHFCPQQPQPYEAMMYSGSVSFLTQTLGVQHIIEIDDEENLTEEFIGSQLRR